MIGALAAALYSTVPLLMPDELPVYPGTVLTRIGEQLIVDGMPQRSAFFVARDSLEVVALYFLREWNGKGYLTTADGDLRQEMVVSAFSTREAIQRAVVLRAQGKTTIGFSLLRWLRAASAPLNVQPSVEGQLFVHDSHPPNEPHLGSHRTLLVNSDLAQARKTMIERLEAIGCHLIQDQRLSIESRCPVGRVRTLFVAQSPDLTAVLETRIDETFDERRRENEW